MTRDDMFEGLVGCAKGTCLRRATRIATYGTRESGEVRMESCDEHGRDPVEPLEQADAARQWNEKNARWLS